jgi:SlyX protein
VEERLEEVENRIGYQGRLLDELNEVVIKQQEHIDRLQMKVESLSRVIEGLDSGGIDPGEEPPPPHY